MESGTKAHEVVMANRKKKGLKRELPDINDFLDRL